MNASQTMAGRQFIAGRRIASGEATLLSLRAVDGEATGHRFYPASCEEAAQAAEAGSRPLPSIHKPRRSSGRAFSTPLLMNWMRWASRFLLSPDRRPRCRWRGYRENGRAPAASCGCLLA